jgi:hypothetical protein
MTRPDVSETAEEAYQGLGPYTIGDEDQDWTLLRFIAGVTTQLEAINALVRDREQVGWSSIMDVNYADVAVLPWLGQFVGVTVDTTLSEANQRAQIQQVAGFRRGTVASIKAAAQQFLTGRRTVIVNERDTSAYHFNVQTYTSETPDPATVLAALMAEKPAGLVMTYTVTEGVTYDQLAATGLTYDQLGDAYLTYNDMKFAQLP